MSEGDRSRRGKIDRRTAGRLAGAAALVVVLGAILGPSILTTHPAPTFPDASQVAAHPSASHRPGSTTQPTPEPTLDPWGQLDVPPFEPLAEFSANNENRNGVTLASSFTLHSLTATPAVELARGVHVDPPLEFTVNPGPTEDIAILEPKEELEEDLRYHVRLDAPDGALAGSWTFTTEAPLHVVGTIPGDQSTQVPLNTGIEVEFDQDGTKSLPDHFRIEPAVSGRFEQHERVWSFVPDAPLAPTTIYTVTVTAGVSIEGSKQVLEQPSSFQFETDLANPQSSGRVFAFDRAIFETKPGERPVLPLGEWYDDEEGSGEPPSSVKMLVHRLATFSDALDAATRLAGRDAWAIYAPTATVDTSDLTLVARVDGTLLHSGWELYVRLPIQPAAGFYIVTVGEGRLRSQLLLQVTNIAAYAVTAQEDTVVWVNDLASGAALPNAMVSFAGGAAIGSTNTSGVLHVPTPDALRTTATFDMDGSLQEPGAHFLALRAADGRRLLVPVGLRTAWYWGGYDGSGWYEGGATDWWLLFRTDRTAYRQTDTINVSGLIRARSDRSAPDRAEVRLRVAEGDADVAIARTTVRPSERGVFTGSIHFADLPRGSYMLDLVAGGARVDSIWIEITDIRKPAYRIEVETDRHVYVVGDPVGVSATASFFDGTPVPGMDLHFSAFDVEASATTDELGSTTVTLKAGSSYSPEGWFGDYVGVAPVRPEEGQIEGSTQVVLVPSRYWLTGDGSLVDGKVVVRGTLTFADIAGMEAKLDAGGYLEDESDGPGGPIAGGSIRIKVTHFYYTKTQTGTSYDFVEKRVVPVYDYRSHRESLGSWTVTSDSAGAFRFSTTAPVATDSYEVDLVATDPQSRSFHRTLYVSAPWEPRDFGQPFLGRQGSCGFRPTLDAHLDEPFTVVMRDGDGKTASTGRFLFLVTERGSMETTIQDVAKFSRTLREADLPGFLVRGIWLTDEGYFVADAAARVDPNDKRLTITLTPDKARYRPGGHASVAITTTGPDGQPVASDVVVQGVDEKLFSIGVAYDDDPAPNLMRGTSDGLLQSYTTHALPAYDPGGCGATGGGDRNDFRDVVTFQRVTTGADGRGVIEFDLSDDLTSWHLTATAVDDALDSGYASVQIPVGLPFFADAVLAPEYLTGEEPILRVRTFGRALSDQDAVRVTVSAPSLDLAPVTVAGAGFDALRVALPALVAGDHQIRIAAESSIGGKTYRDVLIRTIHVVDSRLAGRVTNYDMLLPGFAPQGGPGFTTYAITDEGRGRLIELLESLAWDESARFDKLAAADLAQRLLIQEFGYAPGTFVPSDFDPSRYQRGGITLLPYSSADLFLSARAALVVPDLIDRSWLRDSFAEVAADDVSTRERDIVALAGRAGLGDDVLDELGSYVGADLTVRERLWLGLGFAASGDDSTARTIERELLSEAGQRLGPWVRLSTGHYLRDTLEASGLLLLLAGRLGDPLAHDVSNYLRDVTNSELAFPLEQIGYIEGFLDRLPRNPGRFAWTVGGERHEIALRPGGGYTLLVTSEQRQSLTLERLDGDLAVVTSWTSPDFELPTSPVIHVTRIIDPADDAPDDKLVHIRFKVSFGPQSVHGCYLLTDVAPSGLTPLAASAGWPDDEESQSSTDVSPWSVEGQTVRWCAGPSDRAYDYVYAARVVSPGTYRWEPAILQFELQPGTGATTPATSYTIR